MTSRAELSSERERAVPRPQINVPRLRVDDSQAEAREQRRKGYGYLVRCGAGYREVLAEP